MNENTEKSIDQAADDCAYKIVMSRGEAARALGFLTCAGIIAVATWDTIKTGAEYIYLKVQKRRLRKRVNKLNAMIDEVREKLEKEEHEMEIVDE